MNKFTFDPEGYKQAKEWLIEIGKWEVVSNGGFSVDGWSIIESANFLWEQLHTEVK